MLDQDEWTHQSWHVAAATGLVLYCFTALIISCFSELRSHQKWYTAIQVSDVNMKPTRIITTAWSVNASVMLLKLKWFAAGLTLTLVINKVCLFALVGGKKCDSECNSNRIVSMQAHRHNQKHSAVILDKTWLLQVHSDAERLWLQPEEHSQCQPVRSLPHCPPSAFSSHALKDIVALPLVLCCLSLFFYFSDLLSPSLPLTVSLSLLASIR